MINRMLAVLTAALGSVFALCALFSISADADDREKLLGNWKLVSVYAEDVQTKQGYNPYGDHPKGYIAFTSAARFFALITADRPKPPQSRKSRPRHFDLCLHTLESSGSRVTNSSLRSMSRGIRLGLIPSKLVSGASKAIACTSLVRQYQTQTSRAVR